eukprot:TRINITY_DN422_c0_g4_i1.p1 TRINITY_DN422_c0_g4~~TRINITY_DN422_c0_g4_i1.p1  ORF type:complete len:955 (-),score=157.50 TRINITY_DN422_c0_g4_i1:723-3587(-)
MSEKDKLAKLLFVGDAGVGKTALLHSLSNLKAKNRYQNVTEPTVGVDVDACTLKLKCKAKLSIWDFSGAPEYHVTHQYFFSRSRCIYVLCVSTQQPIEPQLEFWSVYLDSIIDYRSRSSSKILLVGTKFDIVPDHEKPAKEKIFADAVAKYAFTDYVTCTATEVSGLRKLLASINELAKDQAKPVPKAAFTIARNVIASTENYVHKLDDADEESVAAYSILHDVGSVVFHQVSGIVCTQPIVFAKVLAVFFGPFSHRDALMAYKFMTLQHQAILSLVAVRNIILKCFDVLEIVPPTQDQLTEDFAIVKMLTSMGLCMRLTDEEAQKYGQSGYLFPALRNKGSFVWPEPKLESGGDIYTFGARVSDMMHDILLPHLSSTLQLALRAHFQPKTPYPVVIYSNGMQITLQGGNMAVFLVDEEETCLDILIRGEKVITIWNTIHKLVKALSNELPGTSLRAAPLDPEALLSLAVLSPLNLSEVTPIQLKQSASQEYFLEGTKGTPTATSDVPFHPSMFDELPLESVNTADGKFSLCEILVPDKKNYQFGWASLEHRRVYNWVKAHFDNWVGGEHIDHFQVSKIVYYRSKEMETAFSDNFETMRNKEITRDWLNGDQMDANTKNGLEWVMARANRHLATTPGEEQTSLAVTWHAPSTWELRKSPKSQMAETTLEFGKGYYFSFLPNTGENVIEYMRENSKLDADKPMPPVIFSWALLGNIYPAVEPPPDGARSPLQKGSGYDSLYGLVQRPSQASTPVYCTPLTVGGPDYDRSMVRDPNLILPQFAVYYELAKKAAKSKWNLIWVDHKHDHNEPLAKSIRANGVSVLMVNTSEEVKDWLLNEGPKLADDEMQQLRIISNRYRQNDGRDMAGERLCQWLKHPNSPFTSVPFLFFVGNEKQVMLKTDEKRRIFVTSSANVLLDFCGKEFEAGESLAKSMITVTRGRASALKLTGRKKGKKK